MTRYRFGDYRLDDATGELIGPHGSRRLEPQPARVLALLLESGGELLPGETLQREIWGDTHVARDEGLAYCIRRVRAALGDQAATPRFVETLPRRGYRFLVPVEVLADGTPEEEPAGEVREVAKTTAAAWWIPAALLGLALLVAALVAQRNRDSHPGPASAAEAGGPAAGAPPTVPPKPATEEAATPVPASPSPIRLGILPLAPPEGPPSPYDRELERALVAALTAAGAGRLEVVGPATTGAVDPRGRSQPELAREVGVDYLLSGGASMDGEIAFLQLIRGADGAHLWARRAAAGPPDRLAAEAAEEILRRLPER